VKTRILISMVLFCLGCVLIQQAMASEPAADDNLIQMAILLDTSNSMDGLIEQAKSQLWNIVNEMALAKRNGQSPNLEVALYEYGKSTIPMQEGHLRMILPLTTDLDGVAEQLFNLKTNGGEEYCGSVIQSATNSLKWSVRSDVLKAIFIAGNEPFTQGKVDYRKACQAAIKKGIIVNTIYCGPFKEGVNTKWKDGAMLADGKYMNIDQNQKIVDIQAPQDQEIARLGQELNKTYIYYGKKGKIFKYRQKEQDNAALGMATGVMVQRSVTKSSKFYKNKSWDLIDATDEKEVDLDKIPIEELPDEMKKMDAKQRKEYIEKKKQERRQIQTKIKILNEQRQKYVAKERKKISQQNTLDQVIINAIREQAKKKKYKFE